MVLFPTVLAHFRTWILLVYVGITGKFSQAYWLSPLVSYYSNIPKVQEYFAQQIQNDGINLQWARNTNGYRSLRDTSEDGRVMMLVGHVLLSPDTHRPTMAYPPEKSDRMSFKGWLRTASQKKKGMMVKVLRNNVVRAAMEEIFAADEYFESPLWVHADILRGPNSNLSPLEVIEPKLFVELAAKLLPHVTVSVGWLSEVFKDDRHDNHYSWRNVLDMIDWTYELKQPVNYVVRALYTPHSEAQLLFLLTTKDSSTMTFWVDDIEPDLDEMQQDVVFHSLASIRKWTPKSRVFYDFPPSSAYANYKDYYRQMHERIFMPMNKYDAKEWRTVQFLNADHIFSAVIQSDFAVAFVGWPTGFLLSEKRFSEQNYTDLTLRPSSQQRVDGLVVFVPKKRHKSRRGTHTFSDEAGIAIFLLSSVDDIPGPLLRGGVRAFISHDGYIALEDRTKLVIGNRSNIFAPRSVAKLPAFECYHFSVEDFNAYVEFEVSASLQCQGISAKMLPPLSEGTTRRLRISVEPVAGLLRHVVVQKAGDATVDAVLENLQHSNACQLCVSVALFSLLPWLIILSYILCPDELIVQ